MLTVVRSPASRIPVDAAFWLEGAAKSMYILSRRPERCLWIVPTDSLRRVRLRELTSTTVLLPEIHTLEGMVSLARSHSSQAMLPQGEAERMLRLARAWQTVSGRPAGKGFLERLDLLVHDWQACAMPSPARPTDAIEMCVQLYLKELAADRLLDEAGNVTALTAEITDAKCWVHRSFFSRFDLILFDGFHRFDQSVANLIAELSQHREVVAWLVGIPGQLSWQMLETAKSRLQRRGASYQVIDNQVDSPREIADLGRRLFPIEAAHDVEPTIVAGIHRLEVDNPLTEVEIIARQIKADFRAAEDAGQPFRLSEVAVVVPSPAYETLIAEVFPRAGLFHRFIGQAPSLGQARPARILASAWGLIRGQWRYELLFDFLAQPLVKRRLDEAQLLHDLFEHRPRLRQQLTARTWLDTWEKYQTNLARRIESRKSGMEKPPNQQGLNQEEYLTKQTALCAGMKKLISSIESVLQPIIAMEVALEEAPKQGPPLADLVRACLNFLEVLGIDLWLSMGSSEASPLSEGERKSEEEILIHDLHRDRYAFHKLLFLLRRLEGVSSRYVSLTSQQKPDILAALQLALESETYTIPEEGDVGVQVLEMNQAGGLRFRQVYVLGLVEGQAPALPEEGLLARCRRQHPVLRAQLVEKEAEAAWQFSQWFESAEERLVLSRPLNDAGQPTRPSPFLSAVEKIAELPLLETKPRIVFAREAAEMLGRVAGSARARGASEEKLWLDIEEKSAGNMTPALAALTDWRRYEVRSSFPRVDAKPLSSQTFADRRPFSPSELETYAACPFRYFGLQVLKLKERGPDQPRMHYGNLIHHVLESFYEKLRESFSGGKLDPLPPVTGDHRNRLIELFEKEWNLRGEGFVPPDLRKLFDREQGVLQLFLDAMKNLELDFGNVDNEFILQHDDGKPVELGRDGQGRPVLLAGKIDRIDVHRQDPSRAVILDYKTGKPTRPRDRAVMMDDGRMLQLPLYGSALQIVRENIRVVGGAYVYLSENEPKVEKAVSAVGELAASSGNANETPFDPEAARLKAIDMVDKIRAGDFRLTPHGPSSPHPECSGFCPLRHACRQPEGIKRTWY